VSQKANTHTQNLRTVTVEFPDEGFNAFLRLATFRVRSQLLLQSCQLLLQSFGVFVITSPSGPHFFSPGPLPRQGHDANLRGLADQLSLGCRGGTVPVTGRGPE
jgi:hypothetical protein